MIKDDKNLFHNLTNDIHKKAGNTSSMILNQPSIGESMELLEKLDTLE